MKIISLSKNDDDIKMVTELADRLSLDIFYDEPDKSNTELMLIMDEKGLSLAGDGLTLRGDFTRMLPRLKTVNMRRELLVKAAKIKDNTTVPMAIDATAGLGEDSILLAAAGYKVNMFEYNPIIAALLKDALNRAMGNEELVEIASRMSCFEGDSITALSKIDIAPDLILLDPMFPARQKSALVKKKFQLLQQLEQPCTDEKELVEAAIKAHPKKIVIKRPSKGPLLAGIKPSYSIEGKGIRYDCLVM